MTLKQIHFGTSGWRGIIADDFTFARVEAVVAGIADYLRRQVPRPPTLLVGYDTRFHSEEFARAAAETLGARGVHTLLCEHATPTPALACEILRRRTDGGLNFTASHNPAEYNGLKFSTPDGAPALPEVTRALERLAEKHLKGRSPTKPGTDAGRTQTIDPRPPYLETLAQKVELKALTAAKLKVAFDPLYGTGAHYLDRFLQEHGLRVDALHTHRDVLFGGHPPEPAEGILGALRTTVLERGAQVGLATDGDADRFGILDRDGAFISPNHILALLLDYLLETRPAWPRAVARSVATTHLVDAVAQQRNASVHETRVGFKYIGELIKRNEIALGGEESAGLSIYGHVPEKDGILACLLVAEMVARRGASLREQLEALFKKVGSYYPVRVNLRMEEAARARVSERIRRDPKIFGGRPVTRINRTDGLKMLLPGDAWVLLRLSGTEPVVRCYAEARTKKETEALVETARRFVLE